MQSHLMQGGGIIVISTVISFIVVALFSRIMDRSMRFNLFFATLALMEIFGWLISTHGSAINTSSIPVDLKDYMQREITNISYGHNCLVHNKFLKDKDEEECELSKTELSNRFLKKFYRHYINISKPDWIFEHHSRDLNFVVLTTPQHINITTHSRNYILTDLGFQILDSSDQDDNTGSTNKILSLTNLNYLPHIINTVSPANSITYTAIGYRTLLHSYIFTHSRQWQQFIIEFIIVALIVLLFIKVLTKLVSYSISPYKIFTTLTFSQYIMFVCICILAFSETTEARENNYFVHFKKLSVHTVANGGGEYSNLFEKIGFCSIINFTTILIGAFSLAATTLAMSKIQQLWCDLGTHFLCT